jgi:hypothetical protein
VRDFDGVKMIDGTPHCPATPEHLEVIVRPAQLSVPALKANATAVERAEHAEKEKALDEFHVTSVSTCRSQSGTTESDGGADHSNPLDDRGSDRRGSSRSRRSPAGQRAAGPAPTQPPERTTTVDADQRRRRPNTVVVVGGGGQEQVARETVGPGQ